MKDKFIAALYRVNFYIFVRFVFAELRPNDIFQPALHIYVLVDWLGGILRGEPTRLVVNMPPRHLKSLICSLALPAFLLGNDPSKQIMLIVGSSQLAQEFMQKLRILMGGRRYRALFPQLRMTWTDRGISSAAGGSIQIAVAGEKVSGRGADLTIIDDPIPPSHAKSRKKRDAINGWIREDLRSRLNDEKSGSVLLVMQRVHRDDPSACTLQNEMSFKALVLPAIALRDEEWILSDGRVLTRKQGEPLHPERANRDFLICTLARLGGFSFSYQYLQGAYLPPISAEEEAHYQSVWFPLPAGTKRPALAEWVLHFKITAQEYVVRDVFGIAPPEPVPVYDMPETLEEFEACMLEQQTALLALHQDPDDGSVALPAFDDKESALPSNARPSLYGERLRAIFRAAHASLLSDPKALG